MDTKISFTGVIPVKVIKNGQETFDKQTIHKTCLRVINGIAGPLKERPEYIPIASKLAVMDSDYKYHKALNGYKTIYNNTKLTASNFFRIIFDQMNRGYIVTGAPAEELSKIGREIGYHKKSCKIFNNERSHALEMVNNKYWDFIKKIGNNFNLRIRECFNPETNTKIGDLQQMVVNVTTKSTKNKNLNNEKLIIDNIYFDKFE